MVRADLENVEGARRHQASLLERGSTRLASASAALSVLIVVGFFGTLALFLVRPFAVDQAQRELLALMLGALTLAFGDVRNYWLGSSAGSKAKDTALAEQAERAVRALGQRTAAPASALAPSRPPLAMAPQAAPAPTVPAAEPRGWHRHFPDGCGWRTTPRGVVVEGEDAPRRTVGEPATVRRIWRDFGAIIAEVSARIGVPAELIVATIATESRGVVEASLTEPDGRRSVGLMQTLTGTASEVLGRTVTAEDLRDPRVSIEAGTLCIRKQRDVTDFEPPLVAAAYNAGSLRRSDENRWKLRSTGGHIDRFCLFFNDACFVAEADGWSARQPSSGPAALPAPA